MNDRPLVEDEARVALEQEALCQAAELLRILMTTGRFPSTRRLTRTWRLFQRLGLGRAIA